MYEEFDGYSKTGMTVIDEGVLLIENAKKNKYRIIQFDELTKPVEIVAGQVRFYSTKGTYGHYLKGNYDEETAPGIVARINAMIGKPVSRRLKYEDFILPNGKEFRMHCNMCGHTYCYTLEQYKANKELQKKIESRSLTNAVCGMFGSSWSTQMEAQELELMKQRVKDYRHCPKCNSSDLREIPEGEPIPTAETKASVVSPVEELKKLKELLDLGIVTQEEFDAKKKQLLDL